MRRTPDPHSRPEVRFLLDTCDESAHYSSCDKSSLKICDVPVMVMPQDAPGSRASTIKETFGLECSFRAFRLREDVATKTCVPSNQYHTATMWMEPSGFSVASDAICRASNNSLTRSSAKEAIVKSPLLFLVLVLF